MSQLNQRKLTTVIWVSIGLWVAAYAATGSQQAAWSAVLAEVAVAFVAW